MLHSLSRFDSLQAHMGKAEIEIHVSVRIVGLEYKKSRLAKLRREYREFLEKKAREFLEQAKDIE